MSLFKMDDNDKKKILEMHKQATKNHYTKKETLKQGLQKPEKKKKEN